ncbi:MAG: hypothetical protein KBA71_14665 [Opitutaceae bacterium]|nr:hypothetical protein [Opitutaceae bacterium]
MAPLLIITAIGMTALALASSMALYLALRNASHGYEDMQGFHGEMTPSKSAASKR